MVLSRAGKKKIKKIKDYNPVHAWSRDQQNEKERTKVRRTKANSKECSLKKILKKHYQKKKAAVQCSRFDTHEAEKQRFFERLVSGCDPLCTALLQTIMPAVSPLVKLNLPRDVNDALLMHRLTHISPQERGDHKTSNIFCSICSDPPPPPPHAAFITRLYFIRLRQNCVLLSCRWCSLLLQQPPKCRSIWSAAQFAACLLQKLVLT